MVGVFYITTLVSSKIHQDTSQNTSKQVKFTLVLCGNKVNNTKTLNYSLSSRHQVWFENVNIETWQFAQMQIF